MTSLKHVEFKFRGEHYALSFDPITFSDSYAVYSADIGGYSGSDAAVSTATRLPGHQFVLFTDSGVISRQENLKVVNVDWTGPDARLIAKYFKVNSTQLFRQSVTKSLWIDANVELLDDTIFSKIETSDLGLFMHDKRSDIFQEVSEVGKHGKETKAHLDASVRFLSRLTVSLGELNLYQGRIIARRLTSHVANFESLWWSYILSTTYRDQISLPVAVDASEVSVEAIASRHRKKWFAIHQQKKYQFNNLDGGASTRIRFLLSKLLFWLARIRSRIIK